ncbi:RVE1, partial [Symbiodinium microadriaticum]
MEYAVEELPLPSFAEVFGDGNLSNPLKKKKKSTGGSKVEVSGEETTGRWTPDEHRLFLEGIMLYGKDWKKMQPLIKTRSLVQIRTHAQKVFKKIGLKKIGAGLKKGGLTKEDVEDLDGLDEAELATIGLAMAAAEQEESESEQR